MTELKLRMKKAHSLVQEYSQAVAEKRKIYHDNNSKPFKFAVGERVYVNQTYVPQGLKRKFYPRYQGPYRIVEETSPVNFIAEDIQTKKRILVHPNLLKPAVARMEFEQTEESMKGQIRPDSSFGRAPMQETDPWDELVFSSLRPEPETSITPNEPEPGTSRSRLRFEEPRIYSRS